jgi:mono/diheme cytochrome c family protein
MPNYPWLFDGSAAKPTGEGRDLVAYLRSLGRQRAIAEKIGNTLVEHGMSIENATPQNTPETRPLISVMGLDDSAPVFPAAESLEAGRLAHGQAIFEHNCSGCHGPNADGAGIAAAGLLPKPIDLHSEHFSDAHVATVLWDGVYGTSMPPWRQLDKGDLGDILGYVRSLQAKAITVSISADESAAAETIYAANCSSCHGVNGRGDGPAGGALKPSPVNFHVRQPSSKRAWTVINEGIPGTSMPAWSSKLSPEQIKLLVPYVQQFYENDKELTDP